MMQVRRTSAFFLIVAPLVFSLGSFAEGKSLIVGSDVATQIAAGPMTTAPLMSAAPSAPASPTLTQVRPKASVARRPPKPKKPKTQTKSQPRPEPIEAKPQTEPVSEQKAPQSIKSEEKVIFAPRHDIIQTDKTGRFWECLLLARQNQLKELKASIEGGEVMDARTVSQIKLAIADIYADANFTQADKANPKLFNLEKSCGKDFREEDFQVFFTDEGTRNQFRNYKEAVKLYSEAEAAGLAEAGLGLARMYARGAGYPKDLTLALTKALDVAKKGIPDAQSFVGQLYQGDDFSESGSRSKGLPPNLKLAYMWLNIAAAEGNEKARQIRDRLSEKMSFEDVATAQALSSKCVVSGYKNCDN